jgi:hypothetical protein
MTTTPVIISRTVTGPGLKSRPMATYCEPTRARSAQPGQRLERERAELAALLRKLESEPEPQRPAAMPDHYDDPDPLFSAEFIAGLLAGVSFSVIVAGALYLGARL